MTPASSLTLTAAEVLADPTLLVRSNLRALEVHDLAEVDLGRFFALRELGALEGLAIVAAGRSWSRDSEFDSTGFDGIGDEVVEQLCRATHVERLRRFELVYSGLTDRGVQRLAACPQLASVEHLELGDNPYETSGVLAILSSPVLRRVRHLGIRGCNWPWGPKRIDGKRVAFHEGLARVRSLDVGNFRVYPADIAELAYSPYTAGLERLSAVEIHLRDAEARVLLDDGTLPALKGLRIGLNSVSTFAEELARSSGAARLLELGLDCTKVTESGARALAASPHLRELEVLRLSRSLSEDQSGFSSETEAVLRARFGARWTLRHAPARAPWGGAIG